MPILEAEPELSPEGIFDEPPAASPWQLAYVRSRQEKVLGRHLAATGVPYFLPMWEKRVLRRSREQVSRLPLLPGYVFFRGFDSERRTALRSNVLVDLVSIPDQQQLHRELGTLRKLRESGLFLAPHRYIGPGDLLEIREGPFAGHRGTVLRKKGGDRLVVSIPFLQRSVAAEVRSEAVEPSGDFWRRRYAQALLG